MLVQTEMVPAAGPGDGGNLGGEDPEPSSTNVGLIGGVVAGAVALAALAIAFFLLKRRRKDVDDLGSQPAEPDLDSFQTGQFGGENELEGDYTNPVYDGKGSDDMGDEFAEDAGELL
jgi:hypothetical protein